VKKFDWPQVKRSYEARSSHWESGAYDDPDALGNVVMQAEALWVNKYFARSRQMAYQALCGKEAVRGRHPQGVPDHAGLSRTAIR
jgi:hypothetical protein